MAWARPGIGTDLDFLRSKDSFYPTVPDGRLVSFVLTACGKILPHTERNSTMLRDYLLFKSRPIWPLENFIDFFFNNSTARLIYFSYLPTFSIVDRLFTFEN